MFYCSIVYYLTSIKSDHRSKKKMEKKNKKKLYFLFLVLLTFPLSMNNADFATAIEGLEIDKSFVAYTALTLTDPYGLMSQAATSTNNFRYLFRLASYYVNSPFNYLYFASPAGEKYSYVAQQYYFENNNSINVFKTHDGVFKSSNGFDNNSLADWTLSTPAGTAITIDSWKWNHRYVAKLVDNHNPNICSMTKSINNQLSGTVSFYVATSDAADCFYFGLRKGAGWVAQMSMDSANLYYYSGGAWHSLTTVVANSFYRVSITFDCTTDLCTYNIDDEYYAIDVPATTNQVNVDTLTFYTHTTLASEEYWVDAVDLSWWSTHQDNRIETFGNDGHYDISPMTQLYNNAGVGRKSYYANIACYQNKTIVQLADNVYFTTPYVDQTIQFSFNVSTLDVQIHYVNSINITFHNYNMLMFRFRLMFNQNETLQYTFDYYDTIDISSASADGVNFILDTAYYRDLGQSFGNKYYNTMSGARILRTAANTEYYDFKNIGYFQQEMTIADPTPPEEEDEGDDPSEDDLPIPDRESGDYDYYLPYYWYYLEEDTTTTYSIGDEDNPIVPDGSGVENWDLDFTTIKVSSEVRQMGFDNDVVKYKKEKDLGNWEVPIDLWFGEVTWDFNWARAVCCFIVNIGIGIANIGMIVVQYLVYIGIAMFSFIVLGLLVGIVGSFVWNLPIQWIWFWGLTGGWWIAAAFAIVIYWVIWLWEEVILPFFEWCLTDLVPLLVDIFIAIWAFLIALIVTVMAGEEVGGDFYNSVYDSVETTLYETFDYLFDTITIVIENFDAILMGILLYFLFMGFLMFKGWYVKTKGNIARYEELLASFQAYYLPIDLVFRVYDRLKNSVPAA